MACILSGPSTVAHGPVSGVELHFEKGNKEQNQAIISACSQLKDRLETDIGEPVIVQKEWGKTWARMHARSKKAEMTDDLRDWAVDKMYAFLRIFQPELDKMRKN